MKIFISWSGNASKDIACVLRDWIPTVLLQSVETWVSSEDIHKGSRWGLQLSKELEETSFGILCLVPDNVYEPWINFEAGALSKTVDTSRVVPFLINISPSELSGPLSQFQVVVYEKEDVRKLIHSINAANDLQIPEDKLNNSFDFSWDGLKNKIDNIISKNLEVEEKSIEASNEKNNDEELEEIFVKILQFMANMESKRFFPNEIAAEFNVNTTKMQYYLEELEKKDYVYASLNMLHGTSYGLTSKGRAFLVENEII